MSSKITPKNLSYDSTLPPFLQALRANQTPSDGRHERAIARPKRARDAADIEEEEPTYVDESGAALSKEEYAALTKDSEGEKEGEGKDGEEGAARGEETRKREEKVAVIGGARKRKAGKVVGGEEGGEGREAAGAEETYQAGLQSGMALGKAILAEKERVDAAKGEPLKKLGKEKEKEKDGKKKKKAKKIKLSFDEEGG